MTDIATLVLAVDSTSVPKATSSLDGLTAAGTRAEAATADLGRTTSTAAAQATKMASEAQRMAHGVSSFGASAGNARIVGLELAHVTRSLTEQLAMGVSPARAFTSEIGRLATASQYAGGIGGLGRAVAGMLAPFASVAAGAGLLAAAFLGVKQAAADDADMQKFIGTLGLTKKEIEKLKDTTVTWGDVTKATFQVMAEKAGTSSKAIAGFFSSAFHSIGEFGKFSVAVILGAFGGMVQGAHDLILNLPAVVGGGIAAAANVGIAALEKMVNLGIAGLNKLSGTINGVLGTHFGQVAEVSLGRVADSLGGTLKDIGADVSGTFHRIFNQTEATFDSISARAAKLARDRVFEQAQDIIGDRADKAGKKAKKAKEEVDHLAEALKQLQHLLYEFDNAKVDIKQDSLFSSGRTFDDILGKLPDIAAQLNPLQQWMLSVPQTAAEVVSALQGIEVRGIDNLAASIADVVTGAKSLKSAFKDVAKSIIADIVQMTVRMLIFRALSSVFPNLFGGAAPAPTGSAYGNVFSGGNVVPFASGGVVSSPTLFPMRNGGAGLMGEAGPEAVMPLARDGRGRLGVRAANGNTPQQVEVHVTVEASPELDVKIEQVSSRVSAQQIARAAPVIVTATQRSITRNMSRPRLMAGR